MPAFVGAHAMRPKEIFFNLIAGQYNDSASTVFPCPREDNHGEEETVDAVV